MGDERIYDAPTAHGGSEGLVFNSEGQVIGINSAYIDGFSGGTPWAVSVDSLRALDRSRAEELFPPVKFTLQPHRILSRRFRAVTILFLV